MSVLESLGAHTAAAVATADTRTRLARHLLDGFAALAAGSTLPEATRLRALLPTSTDPLARLVLNVASLRAGEIDDIHTASVTTPGAIIVPVLLSELARMAATGAAPRAEEIAAAMQAGYGAMSWLGTALGGPRLLARGIWPTYLLAPLGAAATAARLNRLDAPTTAHALAIALCRISGGPGRHGGPIDDATTPRWLLVGEAARGGLLAARAAAAGYQGDLALLDDDWITRVHAVAAPDFSAPMPPDGGVSSLSMKPLAAAKQTLAALDGFRTLAVPVEKISNLTVGVPPQFVAMVGHRRTRSRTDRLTSLPYLLALAACAPDELDDFTRARSPDPAMTAFMERVELVADEPLSKQFPQHWPASLRITLHDGQTRQINVTDAKGDPGRPLSQDELLEKFTHLLTPTCPTAAIAALAQAALNGDAPQLLAALQNCQIRA